MNENNEIYEEVVDNSVSDNETVDTPSFVPDFTPDDSTDLEVPPVFDVNMDDSTVSGSDVRTHDTVSDSGSSVSGNSVSVSDVYNITVETLTEVPFWDKPIEKYTVSEGLLLMIFVILLLMFIFRMIGR